jgi:BlaR1 peptidase M56
MIPYILYAAILLAACLLFYKLLLQKETFFSLNRYVLLVCMAMAFALPLLHIPPQLSFRKNTITVEEKPSIQIPAKQTDKIVTKETVPPPTVVEPTKPSINMERVMQWLIYLYWFGVILFAFNFLMQVAVLLYRAYSKPVIKDGKFRIVEVTGDKAPCSFGNNIFINPEKYDWETYNQVLLHEKIHIEQRHTLDLLLTEIMLIFQWFNPFAWLWRKELESNLEFFTDAQMLQKNTVEKENYQLSLLKVAAPHFPLSLTTNYNQSLLKKRLIMMNSKKSNMHTTWKYFFLLPMLVLFVCFFNEPIAQGQSTANQENQKKESENGMNNKGYWFATIKGDKVNMLFSNDEDQGNHNTSNTTFSLSEIGTIPVDKQGRFSIVREAGSMEFTGKFEGNKGMGEYTFVPNKAYSDAMLQEGIDMKKENDYIVFFILNIKTSYVQMLKKNGFAKLDKDDLIPLSALNINDDYIRSIKESGLKDISAQDLIPFKSLNIDKAYIQEIRNAGYKEITADKLISLKAQGIDGKYITDYRNATKTNGKTNNNTNHRQDETISTNINTQVDAEANANEQMDEDDIIAFKSMNIDQEFISSFKAVGYTNISNSDLIAMKSLGVTSEYIKSLQNAGYSNIEVGDLIAMKSLGVNAEFVSAYRNAGFSKIKADDLIALKSQNVTPALVKEYQDLGFADVDLDDVIGAKATGTTPAFIKSMREKGHTMKTLKKYIALKSVMGY